MGVCAAIKPDGVRCRARAMKGYAYCFNHRPEFADERRLNASKGGKQGDGGGPRGRGPKAYKTSRTCLPISPAGCSRGR